MEGELSESFGASSTLSLEAILMMIIVNIYQLYLRHIQVLSRSHIDEILNHLKYIYFTHMYTTCASRHSRFYEITHRHAHKHVYRQIYISSHIFSLSTFNLNFSWEARLNFSGKVSRKILSLPLNINLHWLKIFFLLLKSYVEVRGCMGCINWEKGDWRNTVVDLFLHHVLNKYFSDTMLFHQNHWNITYVCFER